MFIIARIRIIVATVCELQAQVTRFEEQENILVRDWILVAVGCELGAQVTRCEEHGSKGDHVNIPKSGCGIGR